MNTRTMLILYFIVMNLIGLSAMVIDKIRAMERRFRIPESVLLIIAVLGGSIGYRASADPDPADRGGARALYQYIQDRIPVTDIVFIPYLRGNYESIQDH